MESKNNTTRFKLPAYVAGKSFAEASKLINKKFEGRNDVISTRTKNELLKRLATAQETMKAEAELEQAEMNKSMDINPEENITQFAQGGELLGSLSALGASGALGQHTGIGQVTTAVDLGNTAFGDTGINTSGAVDADPNAIKPGMMGVTGALKGAQAGSMFGPIGTGVGAAIGLGAGLIGGSRAKKDALKAHQNFEIGESNQKLSNFALGGMMNGDPIKSKSKPIAGDVVNNSDPRLKELNNATGLEFTKEGANAISRPIDTNIGSFKRPWKIQTGVTNDKGESGYYYWYNDPNNTENFDINTGREFISNSVHQEGLKSLDPNVKNNSVAKYLETTGGKYNRPVDMNVYGPEVDPITKKAYGGKINKYQNGGPFDNLLDNSEHTKGTYGKPEPKEVINDQLGDVLKNLEYVKNQNKQVGDENPDEKSILKKSGDWVKNNYGDILRYAPTAMNALQLHKLNKAGYDKVNPILNNTKYNPEYMDEKALTNQINAEANYSTNALANASNGSMGSLRNSILASQLNKTKGLSDAYAKVADVNRNEDKSAQSFNNAILEANIGRRIGAEDKTAMNKGVFETQKSKLLGQIGTDLGQIGKEQVYKKYPKMMGLGYNWNGEYFINEKTGDKKTKDEADTLENQNKNASGGFLSKDVLNHINKMYVTRKRK